MRGCAALSEPPRKPIQISIHRTYAVIYGCTFTARKTPTAPGGLHSIEARSEDPQANSLNLSIFLKRSGLTITDSQKSRVHITSVDECKEVYLHTYMLLLRCVA